MKTRQWALLLSDKGYGAPEGETSGEGVGMLRPAIAYTIMVFLGIPEVRCTGSGGIGIEEEVEIDRRSSERSRVATVLPEAKEGIKEVSYPAVV